MTLTKKQVEYIVKDQNIKTSMGFYIVRVFLSKKNSTAINGVQFWALTEESKRLFAKDENRFFFFKNMSDVKDVNNMLNNSI